MRTSASQNIRRDINCEAPEPPRQDRHPGASHKGNLILIIPFGPPVQLLAGPSTFRSHKNVIFREG
jgi:hypothetical protein